MNVPTDMQSAKSKIGIAGIPLYTKLSKQVSSSYSTTMQATTMTNTSEDGMEIECELQKIIWLNEGNHRRDTCMKFYRETRPPDLDTYSSWVG